MLNGINEQKAKFQKYIAHFPKNCYIVDISIWRCRYDDSD